MVYRVAGAAVVAGGAVPRTRKVTIEVELPEEMGEEVEVERLIELLRRGVPLGVRRGGAEEGEALCP